ncbi:hypothetical protein HYV49_05160 [Candidatus Pacearchaeota archaeon]|nr:hypothetical protein [Candidatus Pacearchaeota archaeon]
MSDYKSDFKCSHCGSFLTCSISAGINDFNISFCSAKKDIKHYCKTCSDALFGSFFDYIEDRYINNAKNCYICENEISSSLLSDNVCNFEFLKNKRYSVVYFHENCFLFTTGGEEI